MTFHQQRMRRLRNKWRRFTIQRWERRDFTLRSDAPYVSFTFDDFPLSAYLEGGRILADHDTRGTYFVSFGLLGTPSVSGPIASRDHLSGLLRDGHELGCHTFEHLDGTKSTAEAFRRSIAANRAAFAEIVSGGELPVFAYPLDGPVLAVKREVGRHFVGCRGGGQTFNVGTIDLNLLKAFFLDWKSRDNLQEIRTAIERNAAARGWLIFATHDVAAAPSPYGCSPGLLEHVLQRCRHSGTRVLPMCRVLDELGVRDDAR